MRMVRSEPLTSPVGHRRVGGRPPGRVALTLEADTIPGEAELLTRCHPRRSTTSLERVVPLAGMRRTHRIASPAPMVLNRRYDFGHRRYALPSEGPERYED